MTASYELPFLTENGKINLLITQGRTAPGYIRLATFTSNRGYIFWSIVAKKEHQGLLNFKAIGVLIKNAIKAVKAKSVHSLDAVVLEVV